MIQCRLPSPTEKYFDVGGTILSWRLDEETFFRSKSNWNRTHIKNNMKPQNVFFNQTNKLICQHIFIYGLSCSILNLTNNLVWLLVKLQAWQVSKITEYTYCNSINSSGNIRSHWPQNSRYTTKPLMVSEDPKAIWGRQCAKSM